MLKIILDPVGQENRKFGRHLWVPTGVIQNTWTAAHTSSPMPVDAPTTSEERCLICGVTQYLSWTDPQ